MARTALQSLSILHHSLDGISVEGTGEALCLTLHALEHRNCHPILCKVGIHLQHLLCLGLSLLASGMGGVSFLPKELRCAEERTCTHLPTHNVTPLIAHQWQVAP